MTIQGTAARKPGSHSPITRLATERLLLTGTLPGSQLKAFQALAEFSTYATKTLSNWITRHNPSCKWQYVWEFQKRGALHVHFVCEVSLLGGERIKRDFKDEWIRILRAIQSKSGVDLFAKTPFYSNAEKVVQADVLSVIGNPLGTSQNTYQKVQRMEKASVGSTPPNGFKSAGHCSSRFAKRLRFSRAKGLATVKRWSLSRKPAITWLAIPLAEGGVFWVQYLHGLGTATRILFKLPSGASGFK